MTNAARGSGLMLVTGAAGFVGSAIVRELSAAGARLRLTDAASGDLPADLTRPDELPALVSGVECVLHVAGLAHVFRLDAQTAERMFAVNGVAAGALAAAAARAGVRHFILLSSVAVYGSPGTPLVDEYCPCRPAGPYAESKYLGEQRVREALGGSGTRLTILRPATIYGEGDRGNVARLIRLLDRGRFVWIGDGGNRKSLIHRDDIARACARVAADSNEAEREGVYNVAAPPETMRAIVDHIASALGKRPPAWSVPAGLALGLAELGTRAPFGRRRFRSLRDNMRKWLAEDAYDGSRFARRFSCEATVPLGDGIRREVSWYRAGAASASSR